MTLASRAFILVLAILSLGPISLPFGHAIAGDLSQVSSATNPSQVSSATNPSQVSSATNPSQVSNATNPIARYSLDELAATRDRPLFSPKRRPTQILQQPVPVVSAPTIPPAPQVKLLGVVLDGNKTHVLVQIPPRPETIRLRIGDDVMGWKITRIEPQQVVIALADRVVTFSLFRSGQSNQAGTGTVVSGLNPSAKRAVPMPERVPSSSPMATGSISLHP
jgi:hypothetical protein